MIYSYLEVSSYYVREPFINFIHYGQPFLLNQFGYFFAMSLPWKITQFLASFEPCTSETQTLPNAFEFCLEGMEGSYDILMHLLDTQKLVKDIYNLH